MLIRITDDLYDISSRIKEIDKRYCIMFDTLKQSYMLYCDGNYQLTFPYKNLDVRALDYASETRIENLDAIIKKVDRYNETMQSDKMRKAHDEFENTVSKLI